MSLMSDIKKLGKKQEKKDVADIGAAVNEAPIVNEEKEEEIEDVLLMDKKCKLKENISLRIQSDFIAMKKRTWYNPVVEFIIKKGTEVKPIKETNAGVLIDILMVEFGSIRISVPSEILFKVKAQKKSKLNQ